jgi:hypothetical protein
MPRDNGSRKGRKERKVRKVRRILILCEDTKSSRDYFDRFPHDPEQVEIACLGTGKNTDSLMEDAVERTKEARASGAPYECVWVVFDKDDFPQRNFNRALDLARRWNEIVPCWSNECFELWYLLHFHYRDTAIGRKDLWPAISSLLGKKYDKSDESLHTTLAENIDTALRHAKRLAYENEISEQMTRNPSTKVHELVEALRNLDPSQQKSDS